MKAAIYFVLISVMVLMTVSAQCQQGVAEDQDHEYPYRTAVGARLGWPVAAVSFKYVFADRKAFEAIATPVYGGGSLGLFAVRHVPARMPDIYWYYGGGVIGGVYKSERYPSYEGDVYPGRYVRSVDLSAILGIELVFTDSRYAFSLDVKPRFGIYNAGGSVLEGAATLRYLINR